MVIDEERFFDFQAVDASSGMGHTVHRRAYG